MSTSGSGRPAPEDIILYNKDPAMKIATIVINRPDKHNATTIAARHRFAEIVHRANVDDDVKVLVIRGVGNNLGDGSRPRRAGRHDFATGPISCCCMNSESVWMRMSNIRQRAAIAIWRR